MSEVMEDPMLEQPAKKRKRSGKERQQKKAEAIAAAEAAAQAEHDGFTADASGMTAETPTEGTDMQGKQVPEGAAGGEQETNEDEHQEAIGDETIAEPSDVFDLEKVQGRVQQGLKSMLPVLKRAKTSETQRLIKKIKFLRKKSEGSEEATQSAKQELADLEQQLDIIKRLELSSLVQPLLSLKLRKHPQLKQSLPLPADFFPESTKPPVASSTLQIKVENRLYSSKPTSDAITAVVNWVVGQEGASLKYAHNKGVNAANKARSAGANQVDTTMADVTMEDVDASEDVAERAVRGSAAAPARGEQDVEEQEAVKKMREQVEAEEAAAEAAGWESGSLGGDDEEDQVDSESDDGSDDGNASDESGAIDWDAPEWEGAPDVEEGTASSDEGSKPAGDMPVNTIATAAVTKKSELSKKKEKAKEPVAASTKPVRASTATITSSLFLPSLKAGYTLGDYDSDPDEDERRDNKRQGLNPNGERKNRRGQRERRLIAEKKYGASAKHVQVAAKVAERENRARQFMQKQGGEGTQVGGNWSKGAVGDQGWGGRRPASASTGEPKPTFIARDSAPARPVAPVLSKPIVDKAQLDKPAHPSWEAARLRKQKEAQMASAALSGGGQAAKPKKIVFD